MNEPDPAKMLLKGADAWNRWRAGARSSLHFAKPYWYDCPGPGGTQIKGANQVDFSGMDLSRIVVHGAFAEGLSARGAVVADSHFEEGDFSRADFSGTTFRNTKFNKTVLTDANFDGATFVNCSLNRVNLAGASFRVKEITETVVYGISAWDLKTSEDSVQSKLVVEKTYDLYSDLVERGVVPMTVDDIELAQFVHYLCNHRKMRDALDVLNDKCVLLLGRFSDGGLDRLYAIREWFVARGFLAMIFDFGRPLNLSLTETVVTMAGLSKFVVADLSGRSVPAEISAVVSQMKKPVLALGDPYALFPDAEDQSSVVAAAARDGDLPSTLKNALPELERLHAERVRRLATRDARALGAAKGIAADGSAS